MHLKIENNPYITCLYSFKVYLCDYRLTALTHVKRLALENADVTVV